MESSLPLEADPGEAAVTRLYEVYPQLLDEKNSEWLEILNNAQVMEAPADTVLLEAGSSCTNFMLLLDGRLRIYQHSDDGRELTLYRITPGDVCLMSLNSLLHDKPFRAYAKSEADIKLLVLSADEFSKAMSICDPFSKLILSNLVNTVCGMVQTFYDTAFEPLDMRLACLLGRLFERAGSESINITHQQLAQELGTSREVVSRLLKKLEHEDCIVLKRGQINLGDNKTIPGSGL